MVLKIKKSCKSHVGLLVPTGLEASLIKACERMGMTKSEFVRYSLMRTLQELSLISEQVKTCQSQNG